MSFFVYGITLSIRGRKCGILCFLFMVVSVLFVSPLYTTVSHTHSQSVTEVLFLKYHARKSLVHNNNSVLQVKCQCNVDVHHLWTN